MKWLPPERAHLLRPVVGALEALRKLGMRRQDVLQLLPERRDGVRDLAPFAMLLAPDGDVAGNLVEDTLEAFLVDVVGVERRARSDHSATDIHADRGRDDCLPGRNDASHGCTDAGVHVRHRRHVMVDDRQVRQVDELLARGIFEIVGEDFYGNGALLDGLLDRHGRPPARSVPKPPPGRAVESSVRVGV